jgi:rhodanese-related sulfurtransferase
MKPKWPPEKGKLKGEKMNKSKSILLILISFLMISGIIVTISCSEQAEVPEQIIQDMTAQEVFDLIQENNNNPDFIIIDVRTPEEFTDGHIDDAINIDFRSESFESEISKLDKGKTYLIYCKSGGRSRGALDMMTNLDFEEVYHLSTGIISWQQEGFPVIK